MRSICLYEKQPFSKFSFYSVVNSGHCGDTDSKQRVAVSHVMSAQPSSSLNPGGHKFRFRRIFPPASPIPKSSEAPRMHPSVAQPRILDPITASVQIRILHGDDDTPPPPSSACHIITLASPRAFMPTFCKISGLYSRVFTMFEQSYYVEPIVHI